MKLCKRIFTVLIVMSLLIVFATGAHAGKSFIYFTDVKRSDWHYSNVMEMVKGGYFQGTGNGKYKPEDPVTRGMFVTVLGRVMGLEAKYYDYLSIFKDVKVGQWYSPYVNWAHAMGITTGVTQKRFAPEKHITREEMAVLISRCCTQLSVNLTKIKDPVSSFKDIRKASDWAVSAINLMRTSGVIKGDQYGNFNPKAKATRAEATAIFSRFMSSGKLKKRDIGKYFSDTPVIAHAGGLIDGKEGSNSLEALQTTYESGIKVIELDFNFTSDGELVCIHDWDTRFSSAISYGTPLTFKEFLNCKIYNKYTPLWLDNLAEQLVWNPDLYIVTDVKDRNVDAAKIIKDKYPNLMNRFIIQVYSEDEYKAVRELGFDQIIFSLYKLSWDEKTNTAALIRFAESHHIIGYTASDELYNVPGFIDGLKKAKVPVFLHTVNDEKTQNRYYKNGIYGVYTDFLI